VGELDPSALGFVAGTDEWEQVPNCHGKALKAETETETETAVYAGIDTSKAALDVYLHPIGHAFRVANTKDGLRRLCRELQALGVALIVIEAAAVSCTGWRIAC
jgi:hypothetical protein